MLISYHYGDHFTMYTYKKDQVAYIKYIQFLFVICTSTKLKKFNNIFISVVVFWKTCITVALAFAPTGANIPHFLLPCKGPGERTGTSFHCDLTVEAMGLLLSVIL